MDATSKQNRLETTMWRECESKKFPGRKYLFNPTTGESKWLKSSKKKDMPPIQVNHLLKAPANDRLKSLQEKLRSDKKFKIDTKKLLTNQMLVEVCKDSSPSNTPVSSSLSVSKYNGLSTRKCLTTTTSTSQNNTKRPQANNKSDIGSQIKTTSHKKVLKRLATASSISQSPAKEAVKKEKSGIQSSFSTSPTNCFSNRTALTPQERLKQRKEQLAKTEKNEVEDPLKNIKSSNEKLKAIKNANNECKEKILIEKPVKVIKRLKTSKITEKSSIEEKHIPPTTSQIDLKKSLIAQECLEAIKKSPDCKHNTLLETSPIDEGTNESEKAKTPLAKRVINLPISSAAFKKDEQDYSHIVEPVTRTPELKFLTNMPNYNSTPISHLKRSANQRLECLRQKLQKENEATEASSKSDLNLNNVTNSFYVSSNNTDFEEMDWEPSVEASDNLSFGASAADSKFFEVPTKMEVDNNLMLDAADKTFQANIASKWRPAYLYVVLDTNIFIHQLQFIEFLIYEKPKDAAGIILYLPYTVLQELDKLKLRENIKYEVQRSIRYLNKMFETKDEHIQAQSALENSRRLIDIEIADDNIINCCLQVREHVPKVILLSDDINMRNKAMCNGISTFAKSDFLKNNF